MYTEKVSLRLSVEDKEKLQIEADSKKIPLTTLIRNKVSGVELPDNEPKEFGPKLITTDYKEFQRAERTTNLKINMVDAVVREAKKHITIPKKTTNEFKEFLNNPVEYVTNDLYSKHSKGISFKISKSKLLELMEIDLSSLQTATDIFLKHNGNIIVDDNGNLKSGVNIENYRTYTQTNEDNERLQLANQLINFHNKAQDFDARKFTSGNVKDFFNPILVLSSINGDKGSLSPCVGWVLGRV
ncbi:hypothetical protein DFQ09_11057 [Winogradskyella pacifica]|uniref:Uncharacterized protein n=1 Tax=Winogradskyella pacifica TaxID=664642 RepID=A0A3D9LPE1_9FLAO|nr:hypothetical protein [Winogradskyella pacifica]REE07863.1 hypothetical protein DFQ09_11057 [Winogradskyella pacifica]